MVVPETHDAQAGYSLRKDVIFLEVTGSLWLHTQSAFYVNLYRAVIGPSG